MSKNEAKKKKKHIRRRRTRYKDKICSRKMGAVTGAGEVTILSGGEGVKEVLLER